MPSRILYSANKKRAITIRISRMSAPVDISDLWQDILRAIEHQATNPLQFSRVFIGGISHEPSTPLEAKKPLPPREKKQREEVIHYYLGGDFPGVYLTPREAECMVLLLLHYTNEEVAQKLNLSTRTIEFYVKNMRQKLDCPSKMQLITNIQRTDFMQWVDEIRARLS